MRRLVPALTAIAAVAGGAAVYVATVPGGYRAPQCADQMDSVIFLDNPIEGTVLDCRNGRVWLANPDCFGTISQPEAVQAAEKLFDDSSALGDSTCSGALMDGSRPGDWTLPSNADFWPMFELTRDCPTPMYIDSFGQCFSRPDDPNAGRIVFSGVQDYYWSSVVYWENGDYVTVGASLVKGAETKGIGTATFFHTWPVRVSE